jgi:hypothetical protein
MKKPREICSQIFCGFFLFIMIALPRASAPFGRSKPLPYSDVCCVAVNLLVILSNGGSKPLPYSDVRCVAVNLFVIHLNGGIKIYALQKITVGAHRVCPLHSGG